MAGSRLATPPHPHHPPPPLRSPATAGTALPSSGRLCPPRLQIPSRSPTGAAAAAAADFCEHTHQHLRRRCAAADARGSACCLP
eukprot:scaffold1300_cov317-Prasinococcus_capsulatus_cf.AAC.19